MGRSSVLPALHAESGPSDLFVSYEVAAMEDRSALRAKVAMRAMLRQRGRPGFHTVIRNISMSGCVCEAFSSMPVGALVFVRMPKIETQEAEVVWNRDGLIGLAFRDLLAQQVIDRLAFSFGAGLNR